MASSPVCRAVVTCFKFLRNRWRCAGSELDDGADERPLAGSAAFVRLGRPLSPTENPIMSLCQRSLALALACVIGLSAASGAPEPDSPEQAVARYYERVKAEGLEHVADLMHPDELKKFREMLEPVIQASLEKPEQTFAIYADPADAKRVRPLDDTQFMNTFMQWTVKNVPALADGMKGMTFEPLGHVLEGEAKHVVVRVKTET